MPGLPESLDVVPVAVSHEHKAGIGRGRRWLRRAVQFLEPALHNVQIVGAELLDVRDQEAVPGCRFAFIRLGVREPRGRALPVC
jgi:hypothetical protein